MKKNLKKSKRFTTRKNKKLRSIRSQWLNTSFKLSNLKQSLLNSLQNLLKQKNLTRKLKFIAKGRKPIRLKLKNQSNIITMISKKLKKLLESMKKRLLKRIRRLVSIQRNLKKSDPKTTRCKNLSIKLLKACRFWKKISN